MKRIGFIDRNYKKKKYKKVKNKIFKKIKFIVFFWLNFPGLFVSSSLSGNLRLP